MYCIHCKRELEVADYVTGCPYCYREGTPAAVSFLYHRPLQIDLQSSGMKRYCNMLPYGDFPTLGEGNTPLVELKALANEIGVAAIFSKNEFQNPTGSHKDRMNPLIVARAKDLGYNTVAAASSGNEGVSLACYAAQAKIKCVIVTTASMNPIWKKAILATGAELVVKATAKERWGYILKKSEKGEFYSATNVCVPPVSSSCYGLQGYKTISYELYEQTKGALFDYVFVPVARGDLLWGIYEGFRDLQAAGMLRNIPKLVAVEPFERLEKARSIEDCRISFSGNAEKTPSLGGDSITMQSVLAIQNSDGFAVHVSHDKVDGCVDRMARHGMYLETSAAIAVSAVENTIKIGHISQNSRICIISTSHGYKNMI